MSSVRMPFVFSVFFRTKRHIRIEICTYARGPHQAGSWFYCKLISTSLLSGPQTIVVSYPDPVAVHKSSVF